MEALGSASSVIAVVQIAGSIAKLCGGYISDVKDARADVEHLQQKSMALSDVLQSLAAGTDRSSSNPLKLSQDVLESLESCLQDLQRLQGKLQPKTGQKSMSRLGIRALKWPLTKSAVKEQVRMIEDYLTIFNAALQLNHIATSQAIERKVDWAHNERLLSTISHVGDAAYNSYENQRAHRYCFADTRTDLLRRITDWATSDSAQYIFWLKGRAGTGKSTVALTIAQSLNTSDVSLASFFFRRGGGDLARSRSVISTMAFQLGHQSRLLGDFICQALQEDPQLADTASLSHQFDKLLLLPLKQAQQSSAHPLRFVAVLDAFDECDDFDDIRLLLKLLGNVQRMVGLGFRLLVTSRPEIPIRLGFGRMEHIAYYELALHDIPRQIVDRDIELFVTHELGLIREDRGLPDAWPADDKIRTIVNRASGLFIYAATVCRYINGPWQVSPADRLDQVCKGVTTKHKSTEALDTMYSTILASSVVGDFSSEEEEQYTVRLRQVVSSVVSLFDNLSAADLVTLIFPAQSSGQEIVRNTLNPLHAVLDIPEDDGEPIRLQHLSFRDFLLDKDRCSDVRFHVDSQLAHRNLMHNCLSLMDQLLTRNICQLSDSGILVDEISETILLRCIPGGLRYACRHWVGHVLHCEALGSDHAPIYRFLKQHCLHWVEVMGLIGNIPEAINMVAQLESLAKAAQKTELTSLLRDTSRFMSTFNRVLVMAPLQVYRSGLLFAPLQSILRKLFISQAYANLEIKTQLPTIWDECVHTFEGHAGLVTSVMFLSSGAQLAAISHDGSVRLWEVRTGQTQYLLDDSSGQKHKLVFSANGSVLASMSPESIIHIWDRFTGQCQCTIKADSDSSTTRIQLSPDGSLLASSSTDGTIQIWDVPTGQCRHTLRGHSKGVETLLFSPEGSLLASGSIDRTIRVWSSQTGQCQHVFRGQSYLQVSTAFSPDGFLLASGADDFTVLIWDIRTGEHRYTLKRHTFVINKVAFSPDGSLLASSAGDDAVRVWMVRTGQRLHTLSRIDWVTDLAFSPDSLLLASSSYDKTVRLWNMKTGECHRTFPGHSYIVVSLAFSPDGSLLASGANDGIVRIWECNMRPSQDYDAPTARHDTITALSLSSDGSLVVIGSGVGQCAVRVWKVRTGECLRTFERRDHRIGCVEFSPDGSLVASGCETAKLHIWEWDSPMGDKGRRTFAQTFGIREVAFSPDGSMVASRAINDMVSVWDLSSSAELLHEHTGNRQEFSNTLQFSSDNASIILRDRTVLIPSRPQPRRAAPDSTRPSSRSLVCEMSVEGEWVMWSSQRLLWLPPDYRPRRGRSHGNDLVLGAGSGRVTFIHYTPESSPASDDG